MLRSRRWCLRLDWESGAEISVPEQVVGESPPRRLGESPPLSTLLAFEVCVGASDGKGPSLGDVPILPASSLKVPMVVFPLGMDRDESVPGSSSGLASNPELPSALPSTSDAGVKAVGSDSGT
jgi:hypothetical protein